MNIRGIVISFLACVSSACGGLSVTPERAQSDASTRLRSLLDASDEARLDRDTIVAALAHAGFHTRE